MFVSVNLFIFFKSLIYQLFSKNVKNCDNCPSTSLTAQGDTMVWCVLSEPSVWTLDRDSLQHKKQQIITFEKMEPEKYRIVF